MPDNAFPAAPIALTILLLCMCTGWTVAASAQERLREHEFALSSGTLRDPSAIASDGATMWVLDPTDRKLYAYDLATKEEALDKQLVDLDFGLGRNAMDISFDGTTMWFLVGGAGGLSLSGHDLATGEGKYVSLWRALEGEGQPRAMWSDGTIMWFAFLFTEELVAVDLATGVRVPGRDVDFDLPPPAAIVDIWSDGRTMWALIGPLGGPPYTLSAHDMVTGASIPDKEIAMNLGHPATAPVSVWSDGRTMWVLTCRYLGIVCLYSTVLAYDMTTGARVPANDFGSLTQGWTRWPAGIWSDGVTMWVGDGWDSGGLYAYDMATKVRKPDEDFHTLHTRYSPQGVWSNGSTMWVRNGLWSVSAYDMTTKERTPEEDFEVGDRHRLDEVPWLALSDIWSDGETMWIVGYDDDRRYGLYAYDMATKMRRPERDFENLGGDGDIGIRGISSDGSTMWIADFLDRKLYAYDMLTRARAPGRDIDAPEIRRGDHDYPAAFGMWSDGSTIWVADNWYNDDDFEDDVHDKTNLFAYDIATKARAPDKEFFTLTLDGATSSWAGSAWSDGSTMWVADYFLARLYAYDLATGIRAPEKDFRTLNAAGNSDPRGIWSDGMTMWVADGVDLKLYAYDLVSRARAPSRDFDVGGRSISDIWSDGVTMWVLGRGDTGVRPRLRAFDMATRSAQPDRDIVDIGDLDFENTRYAYVPHAIWSDGVTMWVGGDPNEPVRRRLGPALYAYDLASGQRDADRDFGLPDSRVRGIWSDRRKMWVLTDQGAVHVYAWPQPNRAPEAVGALPPMTLEEFGSSRLVDVSGAFRDPEGDALTYAATSSSSDVVWAWVPDVPGNQVSLLPASEGVAVVTVTATDTGGSNTPAFQTFTVTVTPANGGPEPVGTLAPLTIGLDESAVTVEVAGAFRDPDGDTLTYAATSSVPGVASVAVSGSRVTVRPVAEGTSLVTVTATDVGGSDTSATQRFTVTVEPPANRGPEAVGALAPLTVGLDESAVTVEVSGAFRDPDGDVLTYAANSSTPGVAAVSVSGSGVTVTPVSAGTATVTVTATDAGGSNTSATQAFAVTVPRPFTDHPIVAGETPIRAVHFTELRERIDALRMREGLAAYGWTDPVLRAGVTPVRLVHLRELRAALAAAHREAGRAVPSWTDAAPAAGVTRIRAVHLMELRAAVAALE